MSIIRGPLPESNFYVLDKAVSEDRRLSWVTGDDLNRLIDGWER